MKHLLLLPAMLLVSAISMAQLYVAPNDNGTPTATDDSDSYVYVNNEILYVTQDINLTENDVDPDYEASIYLRNGSQLMQGGVTSTNAGSGYISVLRENPDSDAWDYTFYASPVGDVFTPSSTPGAGNITFGIMSLHTPEYDPMDPDYSAPLSLTRAFQTGTTAGREGNFDTSTNTLEISTRWTYTRGVGTGASWERIYASNAVPAGQGFLMKGVNRNGGASAHDFVYDFRGRPNNGTFTFNTIPVTGSNMEEVLTGNPYPSALDLNRVFYDTQTGEADGTDNLGNSEIDAFLFWDEDRGIDSHLYIQNKGGFGVWIPGVAGSEPDGNSIGDYVVAPFLNYNSAGNPSGGQTGSGGSYARRFAPVGQGFYLQTVNSGGSDPTVNQVSIKNIHRRFIQEGATSEFRTNNNPLGVSHTDPGGSGGSTTNTNPEWSKLRLYTLFDDSHFRDMVLNFSDNSTDNYDRGMDARHPMDAVFADAYFPVYVNDGDEEVDQFVIQTVPFDIEKLVPYALTLDQQTNVVVQVVQQENFSPEAFLWDSEENTYQQITGDYTASLLLEAGVYEDRFFIVFKGGDYQVDPNEDPAGYDSQRAMGRNSGADFAAEVKENVTFFQNNTLSQLEVKNPEAYDIKFAHMFDMSGKLVQTKVGIGTVTDFAMNTATLADGVYVVKLVTTDNISVDYKALVHNKR